MGILQAGGKGFCVHSSSLHGVAWACEAYGGFGFRKISARISRRDNFNSNGPCVATRSWRWLSTYKVTPINPLPNRYSGDGGSPVPRLYRLLLGSGWLRGAFRLSSTLPRSSCLYVIMPATRAILK